MDKSSWKVFKFGGSSLADTECFVRVSRIILDSYYANPDVRHGIVVSAMGGVTDLLIRISENYGSSSLSKSKEYKTINNRLSSIANDLLEKKDAEVFQEIVAGNFDEIEELLGQSNKGKEESLKISNIIAGFGELWSAKLLTLYISKLLDDVNEVTFIDSRKIIYLKQGLVGEAVDWKKSLKNHKHFESKYKSSIFLITGFIASKENGEPTNLGRNGSDYSAAIFASFFDAKELVIWTDVDGVMSADPKKVKDAKVISNLSYNEAIELAYFGAKVIHPKTLGPLIDKGIPVFIRNTFESEKIGSEISSNNDQNSAIKGITVIDSMALVNIEGTGMMGVPGTADKLFASLKDGEISVALISQASSEHSICIAVPDNLSDLARKLINNAFQNEIDAGLISNVEVKKKQSIIAVVGDNMAGQHGIAGKFFNTLGMAGVNVRAIAQGSSERNISAVVDSIDSEKALNVIHSGFFRTDRVLTIGVIGIGVVGGELLNQIKQNAEKISDQFNCDVHIKAIGASKNMLLSDDPIDLNDWSKKMNSCNTEFNLNDFVGHINQFHKNGHTAIIDCTSSEIISNNYQNWIESRINIITPNKKALSAKQEYYDNIKAASKLTGIHCLYETTVAAGLPVIASVRNLVETGDVIHSIEGIFSGTLAYLFNVYDGLKPFSQIIREAKENGYTEPDPRDDLTGIDVARKLTIIGREAGRKIEMKNFEIESLVPEELTDIDADQFLDKIEEYDSDMQEKFNRAKANSMSLRYVASLDKDENVFIGLKEYPQDHGFCNIQLTDNIIQIQSKRYSSNPIIIQGPGAGPEVTAAGIFADIVNLIKYTN